MTNQHPTATQQVYGICRNTRQIEGRLGRALEVLTHLTPDGYSSGGAELGVAAPGSSPTLNAVIGGLTSRDLRWQIDTLLTRLYADSKSLVDVLDMVASLGIDTSAIAKSEQCDGWGNPCERLAVRDYTLSNGTKVHLCDPCRQRRGRELRTVDL